MEHKWGGQEVINGYTISKNALFPIKEYTYQWLDYILKGAEKPAFLKDKINYQIIGTDEWRSAASLEAMHNSYLKFYLSSSKVSDKEYLLTQNKPEYNKYLVQKVDFADRTTSNNDYYPDPIIRDSVAGNGYVFISEPLDAMLVNGSFLGNIKLSINKKDIDLGVTLYELTPDGKYFHLSYYIGRASYAKDNTKRQLLTPGKKETITFENTHLISKQLRKASRLVVVLNVNKNPFSELNYGSEKAVATETIADAKEPLIINWFSDSFVEVPVLK
ncbi:CocE/NonD family hydrolase C-terminal non-catalytic domain-containing protein [Chryseobacterium proteolyticum]|uniref:CocE/NonD family hydrolase C-terminal non-catalytic domain-containing protein n=1 Tax=Chryseobacterium proteolyticum TaxID=118127 RepID=UPI00398391BB